MVSRLSVYRGTVVVRSQPHSRLRHFYIVKIIEPSQRLERQHDPTRNLQIVHTLYLPCIYFDNGEVLVIDLPLKALSSKYVLLYFS